MRRLFIGIDTSCYTTSAACVDEKGIVLDRRTVLFVERGERGLRQSEGLFQHVRNLGSLVPELMRDLPQGEIAKVAVEYGQRDLVWLKKACEAIFMFFLKDPKASKFRKMLMIEQYKNSAAAHTFRSWFTDDAIRFQEALFTEMMRQGAFRQGPAHTVALQFYAPFFLLLCQYDTMPGKEDEALAILMDHVEQFAAIYQNRNENTHEPE